MAEEDDSQKTEEPTPKKIQKARQKGQIAQSQELKSWAILLAAASALLLMAPGIMSDLRRTGQSVLESSHALPVGIEEIQFLFYELTVEVGKIIGPLIGVLVIVAIGIGASQTGLLFATAKIKPELKKISLIKGAKSKFSIKQLVEFVKSLIKLGLAAGVALGLAVPLMKNIETVPTMSLILTLEELHLVALWLVTGTVAVMTVIAIIDYIYQKYNYIKQLRMT
ncbi:MAG: EscU/YscU/HrcU family type III secretion system export apparatus switch protein, partial [Rhodospirillales bacterium]|nr:EscU/YscU/HrcU family type III secretion system export apparatus switch protein [Rhodospirillales bacterium]